MPADESSDFDDMFSHLGGDTRHSDAPEQITDPHQHPKLTPDAKIVEARTKNGLRVFVGSNTANSPAQLVLDAVRKKQSLYWLINAKSASIPYEHPLGPETDLLREFGPPISQANSIHLFSYGNPDINFVLNKAIVSESAVLIAADDDINKVANAIKPVLAWFINSKNLKFQLDNGEAFLVEQLFAPVKFIFLFDMETGNWVLFNGKQTPLKWHEIGFPVEPVPL